MRYNQLGGTGLFVSEICLGTMTFGGTGEMYSKIGDLQQDGVDALLRASLDAGINFIDTADVYSHGVAETLLGQGLQNLGVRRESVVIATKAYSPMGPGPNDRGASRGHIMDAVQASLKRLQTDHIDLYQIHANDAVTPIEETMRALEDLVRQGLVRYLGVSNWPAWRLMKALGIAARHGWARIDSHQAYYSIAGRDIERELVPLLSEERVGLMVWSPLAGGLLSGKFGPGSNGPEGARRTNFDFPPVDRDRAWACVAAMREVAAAHDVSVARVALAWLLHKPWVSSVIIGAKRLEQLHDNIGATHLRLSEEEMAALDEAGALPAEYPGWMLLRQGGMRRPGPFTPQR
ncbi:MAG: aldo/keto reductase [Alphaproteobacteria bacterium]|nr:aldo/keto reductase [Alphaproteobacteria bacterium]